MKQKEEMCFLAIASGPTESGSYVTYVGAKRIGGDEEFTFRYRKNDTGFMGDDWREIIEFSMGFDTTSFVVPDETNFSEIGKEINRARYLSQEIMLNLDRSHIFSIKDVVKFFLRNEKNTLVHEWSLGSIYEFFTKNNLIINNPFSEARAVSEVVEVMYLTEKKGRPEEIKSLPDFFKEFWRWMSKGGLLEEGDV